MTALSSSFSNLPQITREFVRERAVQNLVTIHNLVFDLTFFFHHHPGGADILKEYVGLDATDAFESVGHSEHARRMMLKFVVGCIVSRQHIKHSSGSPFIVEEMDALNIMLYLTLPSRVLRTSYLTKKYRLGGGYEMLEKKSSPTLSEFTSALNGATRLRYGKRSTSPLTNSIDPRFRDFVWLQGMNKRAPSLDKAIPAAFLRSLNGAERLRFG